MTNEIIYFFAGIGVTIVIYALAGWQVAGKKPKAVKKIERSLNRAQQEKVRFIPAMTEEEVRKAEGEKADWPTRLGLHKNNEEDELS